jgi:hypothetical protein
LCASGPALARDPQGSGGTPDDTYIPPRTPAEAAFEQQKLDYVAALEAYSPSTSSSEDRSASGVTTYMLCPTTDCGGGGSETDPDEPDETDPGTGTTGGTTGHVPPRNKVVLNVHARRQSTNYWCGPASGQVVINYSRGYVDDSLNGDSSVTNWKTQATIAGWMKTTQSSGTLGGNLAAALNRPDAVLKPVPQWSYLYARNSDGADMHAKVVADINVYEMPLVIAVKPHKDGAQYYLPSWPKEAPGAKHWIVIHGYDGLWDGSKDPTVDYADSSGNGPKTPGLYTVSSLTMWKVNQYNASTIVW